MFGITISATLTFLGTNPRERASRLANMHARRSCMQTADGSAHNESCDRHIRQTHATGTCDRHADGLRVHAQRTNAAQTDPSARRASAFRLQSTNTECQLTSRSRIPLVGDARAQADPGAQRTHPPPPRLALTASVLEARELSLAAWMRRKPAFPASPCVRGYVGVRAVIVPCVRAGLSRSDVCLGLARVGKRDQLVTLITLTSLTCWSAESLSEGGSVSTILRYSPSSHTCRCMHARVALPASIAASRHTRLPRAGGGGAAGRARAHGLR